MLSDKRVKELNNQLTELTQQHEAATQRVTDLEVQIKVLEESRDSIKRDLAEASDTIRRGTNHCNL